MQHDTTDEETCPDCAGTGWYDHGARVRCGECQEPYTRAELDESATCMH